MDKMDYDNKFIANKYKEKLKWTSISQTEDKREKEDAILLLETYLEEQLDMGEPEEIKEIKELRARNQFADYNGYRKDTIYEGGVDNFYFDPTNTDLFPEENLK